MVRRDRINARKRNRKILWGSVIVGVAAVVVVVLLISLTLVTNPSPLDSYIGQPVSPSIFQQITGASDATLSAVASQHPSVTSPAAISGARLTNGGKPEILYVGGEYCPYCATERWSLIIALSRFGSFSGLEYMLSSSTDVNANTPTFTFAASNYTSKYIAFVAVEEFGRGGPQDVRQPLATEQQDLVSQYDVCPTSGQSGGIPFVDIANAYAVNCGAQSTIVLKGDNWTQVASQLDNPNSEVARQIDGAANTLISAICKVDGGQPGLVCSQPYGTLAVAFTTTSQPNFPTSMLTATAERVESRWTV